MFDSIIRSRRRSRRGWYLCHCFWHCRRRARYRMHRNRRGRPCGGWPCSCRHIRLGLHLRPLRPLPPHLLHLRQAFWHARLVTCGCGHACRRKQARSRSAWRRRAWRHWSWTRRGRCRRTIASTLCLQLIQRRLSFRTQTPLLLRPASGWRRWRRHPALSSAAPGAQHLANGTAANVTHVPPPLSPSVCLTSSIVHLMNVAPPDRLTRNANCACWPRARFHVSDRLEVLPGVSSVLTTLVTL